MYRVNPMYLRDFMNYSREELIDLLFESEEMREYLKTQDLSDDTLIDIVRGAPISLEDKVIIYEKFFKNNRLANIFENEVQNALKQLEDESNDSFFILKHRFFDTDQLFEEEGYSAPFMTFKDVIEDIKYGEQNYYAFPEYYTVEKWDIDKENKKCKKTFTYHLVSTDVIYFSRGVYDEEKKIWEKAFEGYADSQILYLPIPFKSGDVVTVNCEPFAAKSHAMIVNFDKEHPEQSILLFPNEGKDWYRYEYYCYGAGHEIHTPKLPPIYRLSSFNVEMKLTRDKNDLFNAIRDYVRKDEKNRADFIKFLHNQPFRNHIEIEVMERFIKNN